jgi:two-component system OmpR family sensor kinase
MATLRAVPDRVPLGVKLVAALVSLLAVALVVTGFAGTFALRGYLIDRLDHQVRGSYSRMAKNVTAEKPQLSGQNHDSSSTSQYTLFIPNSGKKLQALGSAEGSRQTVPALPTLNDSVYDRPFTTRPTGAGHRWRVFAKPLSSGGGVLVVAISFDTVDDTLARLIRIDVGTGAVVLALLASLGLWVVRSSLRRLREVETVAGAIAEGDLTQRVRPGGERTEVGRLATALNSMLTQLEALFAAREASEANARASEERMRRFVADASHELRTPLTSIRGFSELYRQGAVPDDPAAIQRIMHKIEAEATRMGLLVDDLMLLARLDQQRPLERRPVDLLQLAIDAVDGRRIAAAEHTISLRVDAEMPLTVTGDGPRLRQVLDNLLSNATTHTPPGTAVVVRLNIEDGQAVVAVSDDGPGLAPAQAERVFERFYRTDPARGRTHGGSGLGLSIVAALVAAHGGQVDVESGPGQGATFRVRLPLEPARIPETASV